MAHIFCFLIFLTSARMCVLSPTPDLRGLVSTELPSDVAYLHEQFLKFKNDLKSQQDFNPMGYDGNFDPLSSPLPTIPSYYQDIMKESENEDFRKQLDNIYNIDNIDVKVPEDVDTNVIVEPESTFNYTHPGFHFTFFFVFIIIIWFIRLIMIGCCSRRHTPTGYWLIIRRSFYLAPKNQTDDSSEGNSNIPYEVMPVTPQTPEPPPYTPSDVPPAYKAEDNPPAYETATA